MCHGAKYDCEILSHSTLVATKKEKEIAISFSIDPNYSVHIELKTGLDLVRLLRRVQSRCRQGLLCKPICFRQLSPGRQFDGPPFLLLQEPHRDCQL
jgi:hypothetical protein